MAVLDEAVKDIIGDNQYFSILARMELQTQKEYRFFDDDGNEKKLTQPQALNNVNEMLAKYKQPEKSLSWAKKYW